MPLALLFHYLLLNMFRMLVHPSSGACDLLWIYFTCCIALVRCVLVLPEQYNTWNNSTIFRKLLRMDVLIFEICWALNNEIIKQVTSSWSISIQFLTKFCFTERTERQSVLPWSSSHFTTELLTRARNSLQLKFQITKGCWYGGPRPNV